MGSGLQLVHNADRRVAASPRETFALVAKIVMASKQGKCLPANPLAQQPWPPTRGLEVGELRAGAILCDRRSQTEQNHQGFPRHVQVSMLLQATQQSRMITVVRFGGLCRLSDAILDGFVGQRETNSLLGRNADLAEDLSSGTRPSSLSGHSTSSIRRTVPRQISCLQYAKP